MKGIAQGLIAVAALVGLAAAPACQQPSFAGLESSQQLKVTITTTDLGSPAKRLPISLTAPKSFMVDIQAIDPSGQVDTTFNGYVRLSIVPGAVLSVTGPDTSGRNALLKNGEAKNVEVAVEDVYGDARIGVEDVGYVPADPLGTTPPECSNGIDDNHNGEIDYPTDPGCYAANDNTEDGGTYASAVSNTIYFGYPEVADVRGLAIGCSTTPFPNQQVQINTSWVSPSAPKGLVVTGIGSAGFYVTDLSDPRANKPGMLPQCTSVYAYTYSPPAIMLPCDRLVSFGGTAGEFYGYTEMNFPTWSLEEWDPTVRDCLIPDPTPLVTGAHCAMVKPPYACLNTTDTGPLIQLEAALVRVEKNSTTSIHIGKHFGPALVPMTGPGAFQPTDTASDCDYNGDGLIDYTAGNPEDMCSIGCTNDNECTEYSGYLTESQFRIVVVTSGSNGGTSTIFADAASDATFNPPSYAGKEIGSFTGNLDYFSGGKTFTILARCSDDIVVDPNQKPKPPSKACVVARNATSLGTTN